jgi:hypothetical protein
MERTRQWVHLYYEVIHFIKRLIGQEEKRDFS